MEAMFKALKRASYALANASAKQRNNILTNLISALESNKENLKAQNAKDIKNATLANLSPAMIDRLRLDERGIANIIKALQEIIAQPEVLGEIVSGGIAPSGIKISQIRVPLGVVMMIYESRPNVTIDAAALCIKSGNALLLKGGKEAYNTNLALLQCIKEALESSGFARESIMMLDIQKLESKGVQNPLIQALQAREYIDLVIPRGGKGLIDFVLEHSKIPVIFHDRGVCNAYIDKSANENMAINICLNAKISRPSACNAIECILVHKDLAKTLLPKLISALLENGVEVRTTREILSSTLAANNASKSAQNLDSTKAIIEAKNEDFGAEFGALIVALKLVKNIDEAIEYIKCYGSSHSEIIITNDVESRDKFIREIDSAAIFVNASSRFNDGGEFGLGAEIGISTQKLHVRGPMGAKHLTTTKYIIDGNGEIRI